MRSLLTVSTALWFVAACGPAKEDYTKQKPEAETAPADRPPPPPPKPKKAPPPADLGKCEIQVTGQVTASQTTVGGKDATNVSYWFLPEERKNMMGVDGYVVNCKGESFRFSLLPGGGTPDGMPFQPKKFTFKNGKSEGANVMMAFGQPRSPIPTAASRSPRSTCATSPAPSTSRARSSPATRRSR